MKPGYYQFRLTPENRAHMEAICQQLGLDPQDWGSKSKAVNFALRVTATGLVKGKREMYEGEDRVRQVDYLKDLATNLAFGSDDPSTPAADRVDYYCAEFADELPTWFDAHDKMLLIRFLEDYS